uniref:Uncharacterized protein n=1 Tax=Timema monikensis TaxID=170555 RepID=A0A7R9EFN9_9NEOP|nr:unnamed protein product [Timema monikensis]
MQNRISVYEFLRAISYKFNTVPCATVSSEVNENLASLTSEDLPDLDLIDIQETQPEDDTPAIPLNLVRTQRTARQTRRGHRAGRGRSGPSNYQQRERFHPYNGTKRGNEVISTSSSSSSEALASYRWRPGGVVTPLDTLGGGQVCRGNFRRHLKRAFDKLWWHSLFNRFRDIRSLKNLNRSLRDYCRNRYATLRCPGKKVEKMLTMGCPRGRKRGALYWLEKGDISKVEQLTRRGIAIANGISITIQEEWQREGEMREGINERKETSSAQVGENGSSGVLKIALIAFNFRRTGNSSSQARRFLLGGRGLNHSRSEGSGPTLSVRWVFLSACVSKASGKWARSTGRWSTIIIPGVAVQSTDPTLNYRAFATSEAGSNLRVS